MNNKPLVIDSFPYNGEELILETRLEELSEVVDYHIITESSKTQSRLDKPFHYLDNKGKFKKFENKIIHVKIDDYKDGGETSWTQEWFVRDKALDGLQILQDKIGKFDIFNTYLLVNDLDEIPIASKLKEIIVSRPDDIVVMNHYFISYFYNLFCPHRGWWGTCITNLNNIRNGWSPQAIRNEKDKFPNKIGSWNSEFFGYHFSSCTDFNGLWKKWHENIEPFPKTFLKEPGAKGEYEKLFNEIVINQKRFFYCDDILKDDIRLELLDFSNLPMYIQKNRDKFNHLLLPYPEIKEENKQLNLICPLKKKTNY